MGAVAVGNGRRWVSWMVGMVVVGRQPLFVVDHAHATTSINEVCKYASNSRIVQLQECSSVPSRDVSRTRVFDS